MRYLLLLLTPLLLAADWYCAPDGKPDAAGTKEKPWDIDSALIGRQKVLPGDTVFLAGGTYRKMPRGDSAGYPVHLQGKDGAPIVIRPIAGERVIIDGGLLVEANSSYVWIRDLEITVSEPLTIGSPDNPAPAGSFVSLNRPQGGLQATWANNCKYINLVIHNSRNGIVSGVRDVASEIRGCIVYDNGWVGKDRGHGHAVYVQNKAGAPVKIVSYCIMTGGYGYSMHCYGDRDEVCNLQVKYNVAFDATGHNDSGAFLVSSKDDASGLVVKGNVLHNAGHMRVNGRQCQLTNNTVINGDIAAKIEAGSYNLVSSAVAPWPQGSKVALHLDEYDPNRISLTICDWDAKGAVEVDFTNYLKPGDSYRIMDPRDFWGKPLLTGQYGGKPVTVPVGGRFKAFIVVRGQ